MKLSVNFILFLIGIFFFCVSPAKAEYNLSKKNEMPVVEKLDIAPNLFKSENMFFSAQPSLETLEWLNTQGVDLVINLRSDSENEDFTESAFNEEAHVSKLGMNYISIPIDGYDSYTTENVQKLANALAGKYNNVLIHCASCARVSYFMMAYLVDYKGYKLSQAVEFGEQLKFRFPLEYLLEDEIDWKTK